MRTSNPLIMVQHRYPEGTLLDGIEERPAELFMRNPRGTLLPATRSHFEKLCTDIASMPKLGDGKLMEVSLEEGMEAYLRQQAEGRGQMGSRYSRLAREEMAFHRIRTIVWSPRPVPDVDAVLSELGLMPATRAARIRDFPIPGFDVFACFDEHRFQEHIRVERALENFWAGPARAYFVMAFASDESIPTEDPERLSTRARQCWPDILPHETWERLASLSSYEHWSQRGLSTLYDDSGNRISNE